MADMNELYSALQRADAAGDTQSAKILADYIRGQTRAPEPGLPSIAPVEPAPAATPVAQAAPAEPAAPMAPNVMDAQAYKAALEKRNQESPDRTVSGTLVDAGIIFLKGAIGLPESFVGLADIPARGALGKFLEQNGYKPKEANAILDTYYSEAQQAANRKVNEAEGFGGKIQAALQNPSTIATSIGESLPQMIGGAGIARGILKAAPKVGAVVAGGLGEGILGAGSAAEDIRAQNANKLLTTEQSLAALGSGAGTALFGVAGGRLANRMGFDDVQTMLAAGSSLGPAKSVVDFTKRVVGSGLSEGALQEMPQSAQEKMWMNYATNKPIFEGVPEAAGMGLVTGFAMGALGGGAGATGQQPQGIQQLVQQNQQILGVPPAGTPPAISPAPPSNSPVVGTTQVDVGGNISTKVTRQDGSVDIDGVQVVPPTAVAPAVSPAEAPSTDLVQQTIPEADTSQDYEAMLAELEQQIEGKPAEAAKEEAPQVEQVPTAGPAAPVKVAEPAAPEAPAEVTAGPTEPAKAEEAPVQSLEEWENKHIELSNSVAAKEKESNPEDWTPEERTAYDSGDWKQFSRLRGYTEDEIAEFETYLDSIKEGQEKYGLSLDDIQALELPPQEVTEKPAEVTAGPTEPAKVEETPAPESPVPTGFRYTLLESPYYEGVDPLSLEDADFELEALEENAERGRLTPEQFAQSEIGKRLGTGQIMQINKGLRTDPVGTIKALRNSLAPEEAAPAEEKPAEVAEKPAEVTEKPAEPAPVAGPAAPVKEPEKPTGGPAAPPKAPKPPKVEVSEEEKAKAEEEKAKAEEQKKKVEEFNKNPMKVAMEEGNADAVASLLYGNAVAEDLMPVIFPDEMLLRIPVDINNVSNIEKALGKYAFRITDRSVPATTDDPSYTGPERVTISALYKPKKVSIQGGGAEFEGNRKGKVTAPPVPKDPTDTQISKMLDAVSMDKLLDINSNPDNSFGAMMFKEGIVSYVMPASDYLLSAIKANSGLRISDRMGNRQAIKLALTNGKETEVQQYLQTYVSALQELQEIFDAHSRVTELDTALKEKYIKDENASSSTSKYTPEGLALRTKLKINNLTGILNKMYELFPSNTQDSTDQTNRVVKKETEVPPELVNIIRRGMRDHRQGRDVDVQDFINTFRFFPGGMDFGNWVNQTERAAHLNSVYDAMYDLADVSGISPEMLGLNQKLKLAIGAQGHGGKTAAHYIKVLNEINLTKTKGDGSLGHEWQHGLDWNLQQEANGKKLMDGTANALRKTINFETVENNLKAILRDTANSTDNRNLPPKKAFFAAITNRSYYEQAPIFRNSYKPTTFFENALILDREENRSPVYWSSNVELLSRAFESMLFDTSKGGSPYLVGPTVADGYISKKNGYAGTSYPTGKERPLLNEVYKQMLEQIDPETLAVKTYKMETKIVFIEDLGYAVLDQYNLDSGTYGGLQWFKDQKEAEETKELRNGQERVLTPEAMQLSKVNQQIIDMAKRVDVIMEEMGLFKWPEIKNDSMAESMFYHMRQGWWPKNNRELAEYGIKAYLQNPELLGFNPAKDQRKIEEYKVADFEGDRVKLKQTQEDFEAAAVRFVSQVITDMRTEGSDTKAIYDHIVGLYQTQPTLDVQSVLSKTNNAYSTPLPIGYLAGMLAQVKSTTTVLDPTGGNGMLVVAANPQNVTTIELDPHRANNMRLMQIGTVIDGDALKKIDDLRDQEVDVVLTNPPFGALSTAEDVPSWTGQNYKIGTLDQLIAAKSLRTMANNGRAVLILGAHPKAGTITSTDRVFLNWLYGNYNVADHYEIGGNLYRKQGASWPLRVLVIAGRNQTENAYPSDFNVSRITTFDELWSRYVQTSDRSQQVVVGAGKKQPVTGGANRPAGGVPTGGTLEDGEPSGGAGAGDGSGIGKPLSPTGGSNIPSTTGGRGTAGAAGTGEQQPDNGKGKRGGSGGVEAGGSQGGQGGGGESGSELGELSDLDLDAIFDELGKPEKVKGGPRAPRGAPKGAPRAPRGPAVKGPTVIPKELEGLGLEALLDELDVALNGKAPEVAKEVTPEDSQARLDKQAEEAMGRIAQNTKNTSDDPSSGLYSRKGDQDYANVQPIIQKVWIAVGEKVKDLSQHIKQVYALLVTKFGDPIKAHLRTFIDSLRTVIQKRPKNQTPVLAEPTDNESRVVYLGKSRFASDGIYLPRAQSQHAYSALENLEAQVGNIDEFVANELGYPSVEKMAKGLAGYQIDGLALAIQANKLGKGFIIGDDTGVGKGRVAAAMIVWAKKNGKIPIFATVSDTNYSAMYEDLIDIGHEDIKVGMTNGNSLIQRNMGNGQTKTIFENKDSRNDGKDLMEYIAKNGELPKGMDVLFTAYSQLNGGNAGSITRQRAIASLVTAGKAVLVMDEAHNAAGLPINPESMGQNAFFMSLLTGINLLGKDKDAPEDWKPPSALYLSATFAKRPDNMPLYIHTNLRYAANTPEELTALFGKGVKTDVLQQVSSEMLVESGSMLRRERSYDGVNMDFIKDDANSPRDIREVDKVTTILRTLVNADRALKEWMKSAAVQQELIETFGPPGSMLGKIGPTAFTEAKAGMFTSVVHNYIGTLLLSAKTQTAVDMVVDKMNNNEKVVVGLQNTNGSALEDFVSKNGIKIGDEIPNFGWQTLLQRAIDSTRKVTLKSATGNKKDNIVNFVPYKMMPPSIRAGYDNLENMLKGFQSDLPVAPIDYMRNQLESKYVWTIDGKTQVGNEPPAGVKARHLVVREITGRNTAVDYRGDNPKYIALNNPERVAMISSFQNGEESQNGPIDVLIINSAGATGISLHASTNAFDQRPRHMIVLQPHGDISVFIQLLGRIHRTGQVELPSFTMLATGIPAERRILAMLRKKLMSLKSNTSGGSSSTQVDGVDFINRYGDVSTAEYLNEHADIREFLGQPLFNDPAEQAGTDLAHKASGTAGLLSSADQQEFFDSIEASYLAEIELRNATGTNALARRSLPFQAEMIKENLIEEGLDSSNPFLTDVVMAQFNVDVIGSIPTKQNIDDDIAQALNGRTAQQVVEEIDTELNTIFVEVRNQIILKQGVLAAAIAAPEATEKDVQVLTKQKEALDLQFATLGERRERTLSALRNQYAIGTGFESFMLNNVPASAVVIGIKVDKARIGKTKTGNPYSPSNFQVIFKRNIPEGRVAPTLATLEGPSIDQSSSWRNPPLDQWFALQSVTGGRTTRYIALGNILRAAQLFDKFGGEIAKFTLKNQTEPVSGVVMPAKYEPVAISAQPVRLRNPNAAVQYTLAAWQKIVQKKADDTGVEEYKALSDQLKPLLLPNLPDFQTFIDLQKGGYTNTIIRGTQNLWTLTLDSYRPTGFRLSISSDAPPKFIKSIKNVDLAKKKGGPYEMTGRSSISNISDIVSLIKNLHKSYPATVDADFGQLAREVMKVEFDDSESKKGMLSRAVAEGGQSVEEVQSQIVPIKGITVTVVQSSDDLPDQCAPSDVEGVWYSGNTVFLVADNLPTAQRVQEVLAHEAIGHAALEAMLGKDLMGALVKNVQNLEKSSRLVKQIAAQVDRTQPGLSDERRAKEIVAVMAERGLYGGLVQRVIQAVRRWLRDAGFTIKFADSDILALLKNAEKFAAAADSAPKLFGTPEPFFSKNYKGGPAPVAQWSSPDTTTMTNIEYQLADKFVDLKHVIREIEKGAGTIQENFDAYTKETLMHGRASEAIQDFLNKELLPVLKKLRNEKLTLAELEEYLHNRHAEEYNIQIASINLSMPDAGSGIFTDDANIYLNNLTQDQKNKFEALAADIDAIVRKTQEVVVDGGLETQETIDVWNKTYPNYVPLKRADLDYVNTGSGVGPGLQVKGPFSKRAMGSLKDVVDIVSNIAVQREKAIVNSEAAKVDRALYGLVISNPNPGFWMAVNPDAIKNKKKLEQELINLGLNPSDAQNLFQEPKTPSIDPKTGLVRYKVNPSMRDSKNVLALRVNGQDRYIFFNANDPRALRLAETMKNLESEKLNMVLGMVGSATRWMAAVNTQYNPVFGAWNFLRDVGSAAINLTNTPLAGKQAQVLAGTFPAMAAIYRELRATRKGKAVSAYWVDVYDRYRHAGGKTGFKEQFSKGQNKLTIVERELKKLDRGNARQLADGIFGWLSDYNDTMENAVRLAAFDVATKSVADGGLGLSEQEGAAIAKDLTVNFNRKGAASKWIQVLYAFFNASVQGGLKVTRTLAGPAGRKIMIGGVFIGVAQAIGMAMAGFDDDDPPEFVKAKNFVFPTGDGTYKVFPMPLGYSIFPGIGRLITEYILAQNGVISSKKGASDVVVDILSMSVDAFNPLGSGSLWQMAMPTVADPFAAITTNKDAFGRPIYKEDRATNPTPGYMRSRESASTISQFISEFLNYVSSPAGTKYTKGPNFLDLTADEIDYLIGQATGGVGREIMKGAQYIGAIAEGTTEEVPTYRVPIVGKFLGETGSPAAISANFYDNVTRLAKHENEIKSLIKNKEPTADYKSEHPEWKYYNRANYLENQISQINKQIKVAQERDRPKETIQKMKDRKVAMMKKFNEQVKVAQ